jgi:hypothetical protein
MQHKVYITIMSVFCLNAVSAIDDNRCGKEKPRLDWVKNEITRLFSSTEAKQSNFEPEVSSLDELGVHAVPGHFTSKEKIQQIICIPVRNKNLKTTNSDFQNKSHFLMLVECDSAGGFKTIATTTGDIVYTETLLDTDGDGFMEIPMVMASENENGVKVITYTLFSFAKMTKIYESHSYDYRKTFSKGKNCKKIKKGDLLYNILQIEYKDVNNDGNLELLEHWIEFRYNGGNCARQMELYKTMTAKTAIHYIQNGAYSAK